MSLFSVIDRVLEERNMLHHPFYKAWNNGSLTQEMLKDYACQYYHFVKDFPRMVSAVHSNTPDLAARQELLRNLIDEEQGNENHPALWMKFATAMGASEAELDRTIPLPTTTALVGTMMNTCRQGSFQEGLAALYAYEAQIPEVSRTKIEGLKKFYGITNTDAIKFFTVHQEADVYHSRSEREMIEKNTPPELAEAVQRASTETTEALWRFLDGVYAAYVAGKAAAC